MNWNIIGFNMFQLEIYFLNAFNYFLLKNWKCSNLNGLENDHWSLWHTNSSQWRDERNFHYLTFLYFNHLLNIHDFQHEISKTNRPITAKNQTLIALTAHLITGGYFSSRKSNISHFSGSSSLAIIHFGLYAASVL